MFPLNNKCLHVSIKVVYNNMWNKIIMIRNFHHLLLFMADTSLVSRDYSPDNGCTLLLSIE